MYGLFLYGWKNTTFNIITVTTRWSLVYPKHGNTTSFAALNDEELNTCVEVNLTSGGTLLKASIDPTYDIMNVSIVVSGTDVIFGPNSDHAFCAMTTSLLMTHDSSNAHMDRNKWNCSPFCTSPGTCLVQGNRVMESMNKWLFTCACPRPPCNELILSMRSAPNERQASVCEVILDRN